MKQAATHSRTNREERLLPPGWINPVGSIGDWQVPLEMCYEDLENTIAKYCLKTGTNIADLTSTEYMDGIVLPKLTEAMMKMLWRFTWFGDKDAANIDGSGQITDGLNVELFKTCDGFFKRLFAICAENSGQHTVISANSEASYALQKSKMKELIESGNHQRLAGKT